MLRFKLELQGPLPVCRGLLRWACPVAEDRGTSLVSCGRLCILSSAQTAIQDDASILEPKHLHVDAWFMEPCLLSPWTSGSPLKSKGV